MIRRAIELTQGSTRALSLRQWPDTIAAEIADLTADEARAITDRIYSWVRDFPMEDVKRAYAGRIWLAMDRA